MATYACRRCNFKYTPRIPRASPPPICHNCGTKGSIEKEPDAEQIIRDSEKFR